MALIPHPTSLLSRWRAADRASHQLDALLAHADPDAPLVIRNQWLVEIAHWLRHSRRPARTGDTSTSTSRLPALVRLRYLLDVLDRNPQWKARAAQTLRSIFSELDAVALLADTGLPQNPGLWSELRERLALRFIPASPSTTDWEELLTLLFPRKRDLHWIMTIDAATWARVEALVAFADDSSAPIQGAHRFVADVGNALRLAVTQIRATGLSRALRTRMSMTHFAGSPFLPLERMLEELLDDAGAIDVFSPIAAQQLNVLHGQMDLARAAVRDVLDHLDENGVNVDIEFQVERTLARMDRIDLLLNVLLQDASHAIRQELLVQLVRSNQARLSVRSLMRKSFARLARKVVDRSADTGEHYITRTRSEYWSMLKAAAGGGLLTVVTVFLKFFATGLHLNRFFEALLVSLNYAGSFVALQFLGLTLATKQPAMTAPALARKLDEVGRPDGLEAFVDETMSLIRSQAASVIGNVALVVPGAMLVEYLAMRFWGVSLITPAKATATMASFSILGFTPLYAALTGVLLWASSLFAGWADNWFVYRKIGDVIAYQRRLRFLFGDARTHRIAHFWRHHISGFAGNVSLGFLLGMTPFIAETFAIAFEVRHVTLSSGSLAAAVMVLGFASISTPAFWYAVAGIVSMAVLNVGVSFSLAFQLALRSRDLPTRERSSIYRALLGAVLRSPWRLFIVGKSVRLQSH